MPDEIFWKLVGTGLLVLVGGVELLASLVLEWRKRRARRGKENPWKS